MNTLIGILKISRFNYLLRAALYSCILIAVFIFTLHPISGAIGGIIITLFGWAIPSALNLTMSWGVSWFISSKKITRLDTMPLISLLLGLNTNIKHVFNYYSSINTESEIVEIIDAKDGIQTTQDWYDLDDIYVPKNPLLSPIDFDFGLLHSGFHFTANDEELFKTINYLKSTPTRSQNIKANISIKKNKSTVDIKITLYKNNQPISWFRKTGIPFINIRHLINDASGEVSLLDKPLLNGYFYANSTSILLHNNLWSHVIGRILYKNTFNDITDFYSKSIKNYTPPS